MKMTDIEPFVNVIKPEHSDGQLYACPCCAESTLGERGSFEICSRCGWEDDGQDDHDASMVRGGPNGNLSLTDAGDIWKEKR